MAFDVEKWIENKSMKGELSIKDKHEAMEFVIARHEPVKQSEIKDFISRRPEQRAYLIKLATAITNSIKGRV